MSRAIRSMGALMFLWGACCCVSAVAFALPEGRVYEMVSPLYKAGYGVKEIVAVAPGGDGVAFSSLGGFAGVLSGSGSATNTYLADRLLSGWSTVSLQPPFGSATDFSADLLYTLADGTVAANAGAQQNVGTEYELMLHHNEAPNTAASWEVAGGIVMKRLDGSPLSGIQGGASADLCHIVVDETVGPLLPEALNTYNQIYDLARGCGGEPPSLGVVGLNNSGTVINRTCAVELGIGVAYSTTTEQQSRFNAVAAGGSEMFFTVNVKRGTASCSTPLQLFVRLGGVKTLEVSKPLLEVCPEVPCPGATSIPVRASAYFKGADELGTRVFFTTMAPLTEEDQDTGNDLYMARIGCPGGEGKECKVAEREVVSLVQVSVSHDSVPGEAAEVQGVTRVAADGSRIYFVARGVLGEGANTRGAAPVKGADNLYVYNSGSGKTVFIAEVCSGPALSGIAKDVNCPRNLDPEANGLNDTRLWGSFPEAQSAGQDGRFLVFSTYAQLLADDTDNAKDVYRYDARTGALERVSIGEAGHDANGNDSKFDATIAPGHMGGDARVYEQQEMATRAIAEDGTRIVFTTADPLSPDTTNGLPNVYEWHEGSVSLISSGNAEEPDGQAVISPSGRDIFFTTSQGLVSQDTDGASDLYDARLDGGFRLTPVQRQPCSGDACQGPLSAPPPVLVPGSVSQSSGENLPRPVKKTKPKKARPKKVAKRARHARHKRARHARHKGTPMIGKSGRRWA